MAPSACESCGVLLRGTCCNEYTRYLVYRHWLLPRGGKELANGSALPLQNRKDDRITRGSLVAIASSTIARTEAKYARARFRSSAWTRTAIVFMPEEVLSCTIVIMITAGFPEVSRRCRRCHLEFRTTSRNTKFCPTCCPAARAERAETASSSPQNCLRSSRVAALCKSCGVQADPVHNPMTIPGFNPYCAACCPICWPAMAAAPPAQAPA